jgi:hypothetical protein
MNAALIQPWNTYLPDLVKSSSEVLIFSAEYIIIGHPHHDSEGKRFCRLVCHAQNMSKIYIAMDVVKSFAVTKSPVCPAQRVQTMGWVLGEKLQKERTMLYTIVPYWHLLL